MDEWTRDELVAIYPDGTVNVQVDDGVRPMTTDEWSAWIDGQVGQKKLEEPLDFEGLMALPYESPTDYEEPEVDPPIEN